MACPLSGYTRITDILHVVGLARIVPNGRRRHRRDADPLATFDAAEDVVLPIMSPSGEPVLSRLALITGYAGGYSSFLCHGYRAAERYGVSGADILLECGPRKVVGGQEDQIIDIAVSLASAGAQR